MIEEVIVKYRYFDDVNKKWKIFDMLIEFVIKWMEEVEVLIMNGIFKVCKVCCVKWLWMLRIGSCIVLFVKSRVRGGVGWGGMGWGGVIGMSEGSFRVNFYLRIWVWIFYRVFGSIEFRL